MIPKEPNEALAPSERRQTDRKKLIVNVEFEGGDATGIANTRDIGIGGLYMATNAGFEQGQNIKMRLTIGGKEMEFDGVITYIDEDQGVGVRFDSLSEDEEAVLKKELEVE